MLLGGWVVCIVGENGANFNVFRESFHKVQKRSVAVQRTNTVLLPMAVLKAKQPGVLKIEMTHVNDIRSVPRLLDIKSFNHDRKTGVLNSLINREAGICGLVVGDAAKEDFIIPAFPFYNLLRASRSPPHPSPSAVRAMRLRITIFLPSISSGIS